MRQVKIGVALIISLFAFGPSLRAQMMKQVAPGELRTFEITAQKYQFTPVVVIVKPGDRVRLVVTAADRDYSFDLPAFHIHKKLRKGVPATIELTATQAGKFPFRSPDLERKLLGRQMTGTLVVKGRPEEAAMTPPGAAR